MIIIFVVACGEGGSGAMASRRVWRMSSTAHSCRAAAASPSLCAPSRHSPTRRVVSAEKEAKESAAAAACCHTSKVENAAATSLGVVRIEACHGNVLISDSHNS